MQAACRDRYTGGQTVVVSVRSNCPSGRAGFYEELRNTNWTSLYGMNSCQEMVSQFYDTITDILDKYLPCRAAKRHSTDRPWITDSFRRLIRCRQNAWTSGNMVAYRIRNKVNRMSAKLRKCYYTRRVKGLQNCDSRSWWKATCQLTGQKRATWADLLGLANQITNGSLPELAEKINTFFKSVSSDLQPLPDDLVPL
jgi:hypothetical protein